MTDEITTKIALFRGKEIRKTLNRDLGEVMKLEFITSKGATTNLTYQTID